MRSEPRTDNTLRDWQIEEGLSIALSNGDLELFYQPKIDIQSQSICGAEGLLRWQQQDISPDVFIEVAERTGQITELTRFALQSAVRQLAEWPQELSAVGVAVNLSAGDLNRADLPAIINGALDVWSVSPQRLTVEVTETALMNDPDAAHAILTAIRDLGCRVSIDDFGTGYSSLAYFKKIPADELKIDKSFVFSLLSDAADRNIVSHIIALAHSFGLRVVAEGVENPETLQCLSEMHCDYAQGFLFSKALPAGLFVEWAKRFRSGVRPPPTGS
jgi:sensor c-di-GMP phosphodiesterase-like protein